MVMHACSANMYVCMYVFMYVFMCVCGGREHILTCRFKRATTTNMASLPMPLATRTSRLPPPIFFAFQRDPYCHRPVWGLELWRELNLLEWHSHFDGTCLCEGLYACMFTTSVMECTPVSVCMCLRVRFAYYYMEVTWGVYIPETSFETVKSWTIIYI